MAFWSFEFALTNRVKTDGESCGPRRELKSNSSTRISNEFMRKLWEGLEYNGIHEFL
jgi:hypothetical protein